VFVERLDGEADGLLAGEGVEIAADSVHLAGDLRGGARGGALEDHMLDEVRDAVLGGRLVARAGVHPDAHGDAADVRDALGEDEQAVRKDSPADVAGGGSGGDGRGEGCGHIYTIVSQGLEWDGGFSFRLPEL